MFVEPKQKYKYNCLRKCWKLSLLHKISLYVALSPGRHNIIPIIAVLSPFISSKKFERNFYSQVQGCSGVGKAFPHLFTLAYPTLKHGCDLMDVLATCRFALLVKVYSETGRSSVETLAGDTLFEQFGAVFLFIWCGNGFPTPLFLTLHPW